MSAVSLSPQELSAESLVLGVDAGGTKTVAWLSPARPVDPRQATQSPSSRDSLAVLGRGQAGPGNPRAVGFDQAERNIATAIQAAFVHAGMSPGPVGAACLGVAGAGRVEEQQRLRTWALEGRVARIVHVTHDAEPLLAHASPALVGIVLISGTGSLGWGRNAAGESARCGGWGFRLGDEGSGYAIAMAGLRAAVRAADGRGPSTRLLDRLLQHLQLAAPDDLVGWTYAPDRSRDQLAELSSWVFATAELGDGVATRIIEAAADDLAELVETLARRLQLDAEGYDLALAGGVLCGRATLRAALLGRIADRGLAPRHSLVVSDPVAGAVVLARRALGTA